MSHIALQDCKDRWLYFIASRNLSLGVFDKAIGRFMGVRYKFGNEFLDSEYHADWPHKGTVYPKQALEIMPACLVLSEYVKSPTGATVANGNLFIWLKAKFFDYSIFLNDALCEHERNET
jgi:hypothetical protein